MVYWYGLLKFSLFSAGTIVRDPQHCKFLTCQDQDLNLSSGFVE